MVALLIIEEGYVTEINVDTIIGAKANSLYTLILAEQRYPDNRDVKKLVFLAQDYFNNYWYSGSYFHNFFSDLLSKDSDNSTIDSISPKLVDTARKLYSLIS